MSLSRYLPERPIDPLEVDTARVTQHATWMAGVKLAAEISTRRGRSISDRMVHYWGEPQARRPGPLWDMAIFQLALLAAQPDRERALAPLRFLSELCGVAPGAPIAADSLSTLTLDVASSCGAFGKLLSHLEESLADGCADPREQLEARQLLAELSGRLYKLVRHLDPVKEGA